VKSQPHLRLRHVLQYLQLWWKYFEANQKTIRPVVVETMVKIFACGTHAMGFARYACPNPSCQHTKNICFSCKSKYCGSCGAKATLQWTQKQLNILPVTPWMHITFTMPSQFWPLFEHNRFLLNQLSPMAARACRRLCKKHGITPGIFTAIHTHGRALNWHVHIHLSITMGGLTASGKWKTINFQKFKYELMSFWRREIIKLLRTSFRKLAIPADLDFEGKNATHWNAFLNHHYNRHWHVHLKDPTKDAKHTVEYLGRYLNRPPVSYSKIDHYNDSAIVYRYLSHQTKQHETITFTPEDFVKAFTRHIHEKWFRVVRYYGFLANRVHKIMLPKVYAALNQTPKTAPKITYAAMLQRFVNLDPIRCVLCSAHMFFCGIQRGMSLAALKESHHNLATMRPA
jgi:hypothetical protein